MDDRRFDSLIRSLGAGASRRSVLKGLLGLGGAVTGGILLDDGVEAARRPKPTPKPVSCPGRQVPVDGQCTCPSAAPHKCGPDCCTGTTGDPHPRPPGHTECCDNACCDGACYGEELCCPTNLRGHAWDPDPPSHQICQSTDRGIECCPYDRDCCAVDGCCTTVCYGGSLDIDYCCPSEHFCPGGDESADLCCSAGTTCCGAGTDANTCADLTAVNSCCFTEDCSEQHRCDDHVCVFHCAPGQQVMQSGDYHYCLDCVSGAAGADGITCSPCEPGFHALLPGSTACTPCDPGDIAEQPGAAVCWPCDAGTISVAGTHCVPCESGSYAEGGGNAVCTPCPAGTYASDAGAAHCYICLPGQYQDEEGQTSCKDCPPGTYQGAVQQTTCNVCPEGSYQDESGGSLCKTCACGATCDPVTGVCPPTVCDPGFAPDGAGGCAACPGGTASFDGIACVPCAAGTYASATGAATACTVCPVGTYAPDTGSTECAACGCGTNCDPVIGRCGTIGINGECSVDSDCASGICGCGAPVGFPDCICRANPCFAQGEDCSSGYGAAWCCAGDCNGNSTDGFFCIAG